jgi:hypothetical protein
MSRRLAPSYPVHPGTSADLLKMRIVPPRPFDRLKTLRLGSPPAQRLPLGVRSFVAIAGPFNTPLSCVASDHLSRSAIPRRGTRFSYPRRRPRTPTNPRPGLISPDVRTRRCATGTTPRWQPSRAESDCVREHRAAFPVRPHFRSGHRAEPRAPRLASQLSIVRSDQPRRLRSLVSGRLRSP